MGNNESKSVEELIDLANVITRKCCETSIEIEDCDIHLKKLERR